MVQLLQTTHKIAQSVVYSAALEQRSYNSSVMIHLDSPATRDTCDYDPITIRLRSCLFSGSSLGWPASAAGRAVILPAL